MTSEDDWDEELRENVRSAGLVTQAVATRVTSGKIKGSIINRTEQGIIPGIGICGASKAAIVQLTKVGETEAAADIQQQVFLSVSIPYDEVDEQGWRS